MHLVRWVVCFSNCFHAYLIDMRHIFMQDEIGTSLCPRLFWFTVFQWRFFFLTWINYWRTLKPFSAGGMNKEKAKELTNYQQILSAVWCSINNIPSFSRYFFFFFFCLESRLLLNPLCTMTERYPFSHPHVYISVAMYAWHTYRWNIQTHTPIGSTHR